MGPWRRVNFKPKLEKRELEKTVLRVGLGAEFHAQEAWQVCGVKEQVDFLEEMRNFTGRRGVRSR